MLSVFGRAKGLEDEFETRELDGFGNEVIHACFVAALLKMNFSIQYSMD